MVNEAYIQFETAKLLKESGFPQDEFCEMYNSKGIFYIAPFEVEPDSYAAPQQAQAMRWLREEKKIYINITWECDEDDTTDASWVSEAGDLSPKRLEYCCFNFPTYEAAAEAGIQAACKYIISKS